MRATTGEDPLGNCRDPSPWAYRGCKWRKIKELYIASECVLF